MYFCLRGGINRKARVDGVFLKGGLAPLFFSDDSRFLLFSAIPPAPPRAYYYESTLTLRWSLVNH